MALKKSFVTSLGIEGDYLRIVSFNYTGVDPKHAIVKVGLFLNQEQAAIQNAKPVEVFLDGAEFQIQFDKDSNASALSQAYMDLKTRHSVFLGAEDC